MTKKERIRAAVLRSVGRKKGKAVLDCTLLASDRAKCKESEAWDEMKLLVAEGKVMKIDVLGRHGGWALVYRLPTKEEIAATEAKTTSQTSEDS